MTANHRQTIPTLKVMVGGARATQHFMLQRVGRGSLGAPALISSGHCQIGSHSLNEVVVDDETVSRFHCEVRLDRTGAWLKDLGSSNGTEIDGIQVREAALRDGSAIKLGPTVTLRFKLLNDVSSTPLSRSDAFGPLLGNTAAMRGFFAQLERAAETSRPILLEGETGTGKSVAAEAIHNAGTRAAHPFIPIECAALTASDLEAALLGQANPRRLSAFEEAGEGTLYLDEVGDLSNELQGRLVPVLERGELRRAGSSAVVQVRARLIASTRADLRQRVNAGRFRSELYYRLAVLKVQAPPLHRHADDIPALVDLFLEQNGVGDEQAKALRTPEFVARLKHGTWPGNVRELFNHLDRCLALQTPLGPHETIKGQPALAVDGSLRYSVARQAAVDRFEHSYAVALLKLHGGKVTDAAKAAGIDRAYLHRLMRRHGIKT